MRLVKKLLLSTHLKSVRSYGDIDNIKVSLGLMSHNREYNWDKTRLRAAYRYSLAIFISGYANNANSFNEYSSNFDISISDLILHILGVFKII